MRPIRFLTWKHLYPVNIEKINVKSAVQLFSAPVTTALGCLQDQGGHTYDLEFASLGPTVTFIMTIQKWFTLKDMSNCQQHILVDIEDTQHYPDVNDERLKWLGTN